jgi:hypothetical protein
MASPRHWDSQHQRLLPAVSTARAARLIGEGRPMQMPEPHWTSFKHPEIGSRAGYEHRVMVLLPWRRYNRDVVPRPVTGSPSTIEVGEETRFGTELLVTRDLPESELTSVQRGEMAGELAEAWVTLTILRRAGQTSG